MVLAIILALSTIVGTYITIRTLESEPPDEKLTFQHVSTPVIVGHTLINGNITVDGEYYIQFTVPSNAFDITV